MRKKFIVTFFSCLGLLAANAQETELSPVEKLEQRTEVLESAVKKLQKLKVSGYIQAQYQYAESQADGNNFKLANRANAYESNAFIPGTKEYKGLDGFGRFGVRRGRIKFTYEEGIASGVVQLDITDKGISSDRNVVVFKDVYLNVKDPWMGTCAFKAGIFDRPFGHEIAYSSSVRESPERARIIQSLFPDERDLGAMLTLQGPKDTPWNIVKLEGGLFAGNGIRPQIDNHMDFIGRLSGSYVFGNSMSLSGGASLYLGGVLQMDSVTYAMKNNMFVLDSDKRSNIGGYAKRQYIGFDLQYSVMTPAGLTQLRGEYIFGEHPGNSSGAYDFKFMNILPISNPNADPPVNSNVYMRNISGGYVILTQDLGTLPLTAVVKYDWYNPNTGVSGDDIAMANTKKVTDENGVETTEYINGFTGEKTDGGIAKQQKTSKGDITMNNIGLGLIWRINNALKLTAYYDIVSNEKTKNLKNTYNKDANGDDIKSEIVSYGYEDNRPANVFTLRLQYKF